MFNMGFMEIMVLSVLALVVIGPKQLPEMARTVGRLMNEFRRITGDFSHSITDFQNKTESFIQNTEDGIHKAIQSGEESKVEKTTPSLEKHPSGAPEGSGGRAESNKDTDRNE